MIIIEGPDNAGKSTLVRQLIELDPSLRLLQRHRFRPDMGETIGTSYLRTLIPEDDDWIGHARGIADRLLASEDVYGQLYRGGSRITFLERQLIWGLLRGYRAVIVFCDPGDDAIMQTWDTRDQQEPIQKFGGSNRPLDPRVIAREYRNSIRHIFNRMDIIRYNWTDAEAGSVRQRILESHVKESNWFHGSAPR